MVREDKEKTDCTVNVVGNFKGGVGKTKTLTMLAYTSAVYKHRKTLVIDLDPQANASSILAKTGGIKIIDKNIYKGFVNGELASQITPIMENLDLLSSVTQFKNLPKLLMSKFPNDDTAQINYLNELLKPLKEKYDTIYIDVPPTISDFSDNAMMAADYCIYCIANSRIIFRWRSNVYRLHAIPNQYLRQAASSIRNSSMYASTWWPC